MPSTTWRDEIKMDTFVIGFCGKVYPVYRMSVTDKHYNTTYTYCYDEPDVTKFIEQNYKKKTLEKYNNLVETKYQKFYKSVPKFRKVEVEEFFEKYTGSEDYSDMFMEWLAFFGVGASL